MSAGYEIHTRRWPLDRVHGLNSLADAVEVGRAAGPPGTSVAWLDTETTGLAGGTGTYVFLIGVANVEDGSIGLTQYFLRDLAAEPEMLEDISKHLSRFDALVTFNGTRFDLPLLQTRFLLCRMRIDIETASHLDVMNLARRLWHRRLGGYSMALLEQTVLKVERAGDVPGWMIPSLYVQFLQSGDFDLLEPVFAHNAHDILSLVALHGIAGDILAHPERVPVTVDWFGLGLLLDARGRTEPAAECYRRALKDERDPGVRRRTVTALARHYRRTGLLEPLLIMWADEVERGVLSPWLAFERLAMVWEWELRNPARALAYTDQALAAVGGALPAFELTHRRERLRRKLAADPNRIPPSLADNGTTCGQLEQGTSITKSGEWPPTLRHVKTHRGGGDSGGRRVTPSVRVGPQVDGRWQKRFPPNSSVSSTPTAPSKTN